MGCTSSKQTNPQPDLVTNQFSYEAEAVHPNPEIHISKHELHKQQRAAVPPPPTKWSQTTNSNRDIWGNWLHTKRAKTQEEVQAQRRYETRHLTEEQRRRRGGGESEGREER